MSLSTTDVVEVAASGAHGPPPCPFDDLVELYHATLPTCTRVAKLTDKRRGHMRARWRDVWEQKRRRGKPHSAGDLIAYFADFFATAAESPFLTGKVSGTNGRPPFVADIDFLFNESKFMKIIEGGYPPALTRAA